MAWVVVEALSQDVLCYSDNDDIFVCKSSNNAAVSTTAGQERDDKTGEHLRRDPVVDTYQPLASMYGLPHGSSSVK